TNQGVFTALRFPKARVVGSDLSTISLQRSARIAASLGVTNLELREESINQATYREQFDYIISTGVIHHNADPAAALKNIAAALKPSGILEIMVYNRYHRIANTAFQKAIRILHDHRSAEDFESELTLAKKLVKEMTRSGTASFPSMEEDSPEAYLADRLIQPVEISYTIESLEELVQGCGLEMLLPCVNMFDRADQRLSWNMEFSDPELQERYESLADTRRWQVTNLCLLEESPMLWFYLQRRDSGRQRKGEQELCQEFLATRFVRASTMQRNYLLGDNYAYEPKEQAILYPGKNPPGTLASRVLASIDAQSSMRQILQRLGFQLTFSLVNGLRIQLTTPAFPYLQAITEPQVEKNSQLRSFEGLKNTRPRQMLPHQ
ncbi:MAG TPA: methyltransferase domain-containing protein, partial [Ktedonobacteraceae bacterium]|nr:methyltransferase domain-containing protein [Ktedonobacteraceae bacterium]